MARPSKYNDKLARTICASLAEGKSLASICKPASMPSVTSIYSWLQDKPEFLELYTRAKEDSADRLAEEIIDIADNEEGDTNRDRLRLDARKWVAAKLKPKKYGDKIQASHDGSLTVIIKKFGDE